MRWIKTAGYRVILALLLAPAAMAHAQGTSSLGGVTVEELKALPPLPKVHYSYPIWTYLDPVHPAIREYVRIARAAVVSGQHHGEQVVQNAVELCCEVDATLGVHYSPYHVFKPGPLDFGRLHHRELMAMYSKLSQVRRWVDGRVPVTMVLLECERYWILPEHSSEQRAATIRRYDQAYVLAKSIFPDAVIEWYNRGQIILVEKAPNFEIEWKNYSRFCGEEMGDAYSCSLYCLPEIGYTRETVTRTQAHALEHGVPVHVWIGLACGYQRDPKHPGTLKFALDWDYNLAYPWHAGFDVNRRWDVRAGIFYPSPFDHRTPQWGKHFWAYVKGARKAPL